MTDIARPSTGTGLSRRTALGILSIPALALAGCSGSDGSAASPPTRTGTGSGPVTNPTPTGARSGPTAADWQALARSIDGTLLRPGQAGFGTAHRLYDPRYDSRAPVAVVTAARAHDVAETVRFVRRFGLPVATRSGGHSYVGASARTGAVVIRTTGLAGVRYDASTGQVGVGAGAQLFDVHSALDPRGRTVPTGTCPTVGAAGLTLGGGIGVEDRAYGLTCDTVASMTVVTADGRVRTIDDTRDPDLFWGMRGGGGGNFAVLCSIQMATSPAHSVGFYFLSWPISQAAAVLRGWQRQLVTMPRSSWSNVHLDISGGTWTVKILGVSLTGDAHAAAAAVESSVGQPPTSASFTVHTHHDAVRLLAGCLGDTDEQCHLPPVGTQPRQSFVAGSDVLGTPMGPRVIGSLLSVVRTRASSGGSASVILDPLGGRIASPGTGAGAFPWRSAEATIQWYIGLPVGAPPAQVSSGLAWIRSGHAAVAATSVGAYVNYLEPGRPMRSYYGSSFARLRAVRSRYDPTGVFAGPYTIPA
ncbi:MAG: FAD-binding protein [Nocardioidaceae bacterium]